jgi:ketosteroid isomerase-like protein
MLISEEHCMKYMKRRGLKLFAVAALLPVLSSGVLAQASTAAVAQPTTVSAKDAAITLQLTQMVRDFLADVPKGDRTVFDNFFADDVIYTRATGITVGKAEIMKNIDVRSANQPQATFAADGFTVHPYGDLAVVNFRLIMHDVADGKPVTVYFRNTGSFLKRNGKWQVVAWHATRVPDTTEAKP